MLPLWPHNVDKALTIADLKAMARARVPKMFFDYADSGAWTEGTYRANEDDFHRIKLRQRVLVDMDLDGIIANARQWRERIATVRPA